MSIKAEAKEALKEEKARLHKEISSLKKISSDYKAERKANWKSFKVKMKDDIGKIEKSVDKLVTGKRKRKKEVLLSE